MSRKYLLPFFAVLGAIIALLVVFWSQRKTPVPPILFPPPHSPYEHSIAAAGQIEASSQNISIGSPFNEVIDKIFVLEGDKVKIGDPLFQLDLRAFNAAVETAQASLKAALATLEDRKKQFSFYERLTNKSSVSEQLYQQAYYAYVEAEENLKVASANVQQAEANVERSVIRAPIDGEILQVNIHVGEIAPVTPFTSAQALWQTANQGSLLLMGAVDPLQVRINIDEDESWRFQPGARATAFVRGNSHINFPLTYVRFQPFVIPKPSFTGQTAERVDTRVLQVLYNFNRKDLPVFTGQVVDIFIEAPAFESFIKKND